MQVKRQRSGKMGALFGMPERRFSYRHGADDQAFGQDRRLYSDHQAGAHAAALRRFQMGIESNTLLHTPRNSRTQE